MADVSIRVGLDVGGLLANSARGVSAIKEIERAMDAAQKKGDVDLVGHLAYEKDKLQGGMFRYNQEVKAFSGSAKFQEYQTVLAKGEDVSRFTKDHEFVSRLKALDESNKALAEALDGLRDSVKKGDFKEIQQANTSVGQEINKVAGQITTPEAGNSDAKALAGLLNVQTAQQVIGAVSSGIKTYISHLDRSGIINQQGSGDIVGAEISELRRSSEEKSTFWGSLGSIGGGIIGGVIGSLLGPGGTAIGASMGSSLFGAVGGHAGSGDEAKANKLATQEALAQQWQSQAPSAMELAGILGYYGGSDEENTSALRDVFSRVAGMANEYGYSAAEGMEAVKQGAAQGLGEGEAIAAAKSTFAFERGTGADRASLLELETRARRFGIDNMIGAAWQGNQASGMSTGQFNEFLRSMQRVFEDGISKGFVRGGQEIAGNLAYIAELGGESELYKGEAGANVMQSLSSGIAGATDLNSVNDILTYQAAQSVIEKWKAAPKDSEEYKQYLKLFDTDDNLNTHERGDPEKASLWYASSLLMDKGFTPEVFDQQMRNFGTADMHDHDNAIGRIMAQYGMNATQAGFLYNAWLKKGDELSTGDYTRALEAQDPNAPNSESTELNFERMTQSFITELQSVYGQNAFNVKVENMPEIIAGHRFNLNSTLGYEESVSGLNNLTDSEFDENADWRGMFLESYERGNGENQAIAAMQMRRMRETMLEPYQITDNEYRTVQYDRLDRFYDAFFSSDDGDTDAREKLHNLLEKATTTGDETQVSQASAVMDFIDFIPKSVREEWDRNDTLNNILAGSNGIADLLAALQRLITITEENGKIKVIFHSEEG